MKKFANSNPQQENANADFQTKYWKNIYTKGSLDSEIYRARQATVLDWINDLTLEPGSCMLEVGCGAGFLSVALAQRGFRVKAIDSTEAMVELASQHAADAGIADLLSVDIGNVHSLAFKDDSFDLVVAIGVIPWLENPELAMREIARVTRPGGYAILTTTNRAGISNFLDPWKNPILRPLKVRTRKALKSVGLHRGSLDVTSHVRRYIDKTLASNKLEKVRAKTLGFGPFSLFTRTIVPDAIGKRLNIRLQRLADRNIPGFRSTGKHYIVLTRKLASCPSIRSAGAEEIRSDGLQASLS
jgi:2-polyprenyl-3-methyl-5-hydroxy-6-metoxy-1,4-benzoquinol methylase